MRNVLIALTLIVTMPSALMASEVQTVALEAALKAERANHPEDAIRNVENVAAWEGPYAQKPFLLV